jgi:hypothetical protein
VKDRTVRERGITVHREGYKMRKEQDKIGKRGERYSYTHVSMQMIRLKQEKRKYYIQRIASVLNK